MNFSLIICTYQRPEALLQLLKSVKLQKKYPDQIVIVDGSRDAKTEEILQKNNFANLEYYKVEDKDRGLTRQRNFGIKKVSASAEIICFLDDDIVLKPEYFEQLLQTYDKHPDAVGVGGYIISENVWREKSGKIKIDEYEYDAWVRKLGSRYELRKKLGLLSQKPPGIMPAASNGFPIGFLPPSGKIYPVDFFMGGVSSFKKSLFEQIQFSTYFEGYGLYEDLDFCLRASQTGQLYVNTAAQLYHYHDEGGRPNKFNYGKMVVRNGWYVWRVKNKKPSFKTKVAWNATALLLSFVRLGNAVTSKNKKEALTEGLGRIAGWWSLIFNKPV